MQIYEWQETKERQKGDDEKIGEEGAYKVEDCHEQGDEHAERDHKQSQCRPGGDAAGQSWYPLDTHRHLGAPLLKTEKHPNMHLILKFWGATTNTPPVFVYLQVSGESDGQKQHEHREGRTVGHRHLKVPGRRSWWVWTGTTLKCCCIYECDWKCHSLFRDKHLDGEKSNEDQS